MKKHLLLILILCCPMLRAMETVTVTANSSKDELFNKASNGSAKEMAAFLDAHPEIDINTLQKRFSRDILLFILRF